MSDTPDRPRKPRRPRAERVAKKRKKAAAAKAERAAKKAQKKKLRKVAPSERAPRPMTSSSEAPAPKAPAPKAARPPSKPHPAPEPEEDRRALSHQGGAVVARGEDGLVPILKAALRASEEDPDRLTHGFHTYPARMHPSVAREVLQRIPGKGRVLDPFCGSGTVLVEALAAGREAVGVDLNPLALRIAEVKTALRDAEARARFGKTLIRIAEASEARVRGRVEARAPVAPDQVSAWSPHTLKELAGLRLEILDVEHDADRRALEVLLSAIVVKFSLQRSDTSSRKVDKRIRKGLPTEFFVRRGQELRERWAALFAAAPDHRAPRLVQADARALPVRKLGGEFDLVLASPPYGGTYDYVDHHALRYPWLGIDPQALREGEIGARRNLQGRGALPRWDRELTEVLKALRPLVRDDGLVLLLQGDAQLDGRRLAADEQLTRLAPRAGFSLVASASQVRPDWTGSEPRREHLLALRPRPTLAAAEV